MISVLPLAPRNGYPTTDGKPMAETDLHRDLMVALIQTLQYYYYAQPFGLRDRQLAAVLRTGQQAPAYIARCVRGARRAEPSPRKLPSVGGETRPGGRH